MFEREMWGKCGTQWGVIEGCELVMRENARPNGRFFLCVG